MKLETKDNIVKISAYCSVFLVLFGVGQLADMNGKGVKFKENAFGIAIQGIGFFLVLWSSKTKIRLKSNSIAKYEGQKSRILSTITYPKTWDVGLLCIMLGLIFEFLSLDWNS